MDASPAVAEAAAGRETPAVNPAAKRSVQRRLFGDPVAPRSQPEPSGIPPQAASAELSSGEKAKARDILAAIRTLQRIEAEHRNATPEECQALIRFGGFGPVAKVLFPDEVLLRKQPDHPIAGYKDASWQSLGEELRSLLTDREYDSAKRTTFNAFYTSSPVIKAMFRALSRLGVPDDGLVLEPGCGPGRFPYLAPKNMRFIGVEMDGISGRIARALHPSADIRIEDFQHSRLPEIDGVIGNVPFANLPLHHKGRTFSLHDYFFAKSVDSLKPGGVLALVTSHFTLDKQNAAIREYLAEQADFFGAIRLPSDAFQREGTAVVTDIVFLRKRAPGEPANHADPDWLETEPLEIEGAAIPVNRYFHHHPEMVLGAWSRENTMYGTEGFSVVGNGDLARQLQAAVERLPRFETFQATSAAPASAFTPPPPLPHITEGSFFIGEDGVIRQLVDGQGQPVVYRGSTMSVHGTMTEKRMAALIRIKDQARRVLQSQNEGWPERQRDEERRLLRDRHDRFTRLYGPINKTTFSEAADGTVTRRMPNLVKFREDPDAMLVMSLEDYDETTGKAVQAAIMQRDVVGRKPPITHVRSAEEGLLVSLNERGAVDLAFISELYGKPETQIITELGDLIFQDPETKAWQTADAYLSGNVRAKLKAADAAGAEYARNAEALRVVQPEDVLPGDIDANLGAPWIPESDIQAFAAQLFGVAPEAIQVGPPPQGRGVEHRCRLRRRAVGRRQIRVRYAAGQRRLAAGACPEHEVADDLRPRPRRSRQARGEPRGDAGRPREAEAHQGEVPLLDLHRSRAHRAAGAALQRHLQQPAPRLFDGSHLDFPGMNQAITLRPHQKDAVWRIMSSGNTLLAHVVGAGKTYTMAAAGMKMKQAGLMQ